MHDTFHREDLTMFLIEREIDIPQEKGDESQLAYLERSVQDYLPAN